MSKLKRHPLRHLLAGIMVVNNECLFGDSLKVSMPGKNWWLYSKAKETIIFKRDIAKKEQWRKQAEDIKRRKAKYGKK